MKFIATLLTRNPAAELTTKEPGEPKTTGGKTPGRAGVPPAVDEGRSCGRDARSPRARFVERSTLVFFISAIWSFAATPIAIFSLIVTFHAASPSVQAAESIETRLHRGLFEEEGNHNLDAAKKNYEEVLAEYDRDRKLAATALFHLAECLRKEGKTNEARVQFERVVREFSHESELVKQSREALGEKTATSEKSNNKLGNLDVDYEKAEIERLTQLLRESPDLINAAQPGQNSLIQNAANRNYTRVVEFLLARGANPNSNEAVAASPLDFGVKQGNREMVSLLLNNGASMRGSKPNGPSPLFEAVESGNKEMVALLLGKGANPEFGSGPDRPLHLAAKMGFKAIAEELIDHKADVNAFGESGMTPLQEAATAGHTVMAEFLLSKGARIDARGHGALTPLLSAVQLHRVPTVELLLNHGANINDMDGPASNTVLHVCLLEPDDPANETLKLLLKHGARPLIRNSRGVSPLWEAIGLRRINAIPTLISARANPNEIFPAAVAGGSPDIQFQWGPSSRDVTKVSYQSQTPLYQAAERGDYEMAKVLLENGADPNLRTEIHPRTPLSAAIWRQSQQLVALFLEYHADPNLRFEMEQTALDEMESQKAALVRSHGEFGQIETIIELLKSHGALENLPRPNAIAVEIPGEPLRTIFMRHGTNDQNSYTLLEAVHQRAMERDFQFPDFHRVFLRRTNGGNLEETKFDLETSLTNSECPGSILLRWGDVIQITEAGHPLNESWGGLSADVFAAISHCLTRSIEIRISGRRESKSLSPAGVGGPVGTPVSPAGVGTPPTFGIRSFWHFNFFDPRLQAFLNESTLPLSSADLHRIKVTRRLPGETEPRVIECNLADHPDGPDNLWLRDGDIVEIGQKD